MRLPPFLARSALGLLLLLIAITLGGLSACQSPPTVAPAGAVAWTTAQTQTFKQLGFQPTGDGWELNLAASLLFEFNSERLSAPQLLHLQRISRALGQVGIEGLRIEGHSDNVGEADYNLRLSERRAAVVAQALAGAGLQASKLLVRGFGKERPIASNGTETGRAQNRRVALIASSF